MKHTTRYDSPSGVPDVYNDLDADAGSTHNELTASTDREPRRRDYDNTVPKTGSARLLWEVESLREARQLVEQTGSIERARRLATERRHSENNGGKTDV